MSIGASGDLLAVSRQGSSELRAVIDAVVQAGIGLVRFPVSWAEVQVSRFEFNWGPVDRLYANLAWSGVRAQPVIEGFFNQWSGEPAYDQRLAAAGCRIVDRFSRVDPLLVGLEVAVSSSSSSPQDAAVSAQKVTELYDDVTRCYPDALREVPILVSGQPEDSVDAQFWAHLDPEIRQGVAVSSAAIVTGEVDSVAAPGRCSSITLGLPHQATGSAASATLAIQGVCDTESQCDVVFISPIRSDIGAPHDPNSGADPILSSLDVAKSWVPGVVAELGA